MLVNRFVAPKLNEKSPCFELKLVRTVKNVDTSIRDRSYAASGITAHAYFLHNIESFWENASNCGQNWTEPVFKYWMIENKVLPIVFSVVTCRFYQSCILVWVSRCLVLSAHWKAAVLEHRTSHGTLHQLCIQTETSKGIPRPCVLSNAVWRLSIKGICKKGDWHAGMHVVPRSIWQECCELYCGICMSIYLYIYI